MIDPWTIIGWLCLGTPVAIAALAAAVVARAWVTLWWRHLRTRNIRPEPGQVWSQDGSSLYIRSYTDNGRIVVATSPRVGSGASWGETPDRWRRRVRSRRLWLKRRERP